jgi:phosphocarrier protein
MLEESIEIVNKLGLHARAATKLANTANRFASSVKVCLNEKEIDGKSIMSLMLLAAAKGTIVTLKVEGQDEIKAMAALKELINNRFDEES